MSSRNGFLCLAFIMACCTLQPSANQAKPPDLPVDPRIVCPEGRDGPPEAPSFREEIRPAFFREPDEPILPKNIDGPFQEMLRTTQPLDLAPLANLWTEA